MSEKYMTQEYITQPRMNMHDALTTITRFAELFVLHDNQRFVRALEHVSVEDLLTTFKNLMRCKNLEHPNKAQFIADHSRCVRHSLVDIVQRTWASGFFLSNIVNFYGYELTVRDVKFHMKLPLRWILFRVHQVKPPRLAWRDTRSNHALCLGLKEKTLPTC